MKALVHYPEIGALPDMVFWVDAALRWIDVPSDSTILALDEVLQKAPQASWESMFEALEHRNPNPSVWSIIETEDPRALFTTLRSSTLKTR